MKLTCLKSVLQSAVNIASRAASAKSPIPALEGILLEAGPAGLKLTGYDLKKGIYTSVDADVAEPGSIVLGAKIFGDIVRSLPDGIVKIVAEDGRVVATPERENLRAVQTPQVFHADLLKAALTAALQSGAPITDDCSAVELLGKAVYLIPGEEKNIKITTPHDLLIAEAMLAEEGAQ